MSHILFAHGQLYLIELCPSEHVQEAQAQPGAAPPSFRIFNSDGTPLTPTAQSTAELRSTLQRLLTAEGSS